MKKPVKEPVTEPVKEPMQEPVQHDVGQQLKQNLDEVEAAMDEILGCTPEVEFTEGNPNDVLAEKVLLTEDQLHDLLQFGYSMAEIESMEGFRVELDDMPHVEMVKFNNFLRLFLTA